MYGSNGNVLGTATATAGVAVLPNTGSNVVLQYIAMFTIAVGVMIVLSTVIRFIAKRVYKA